MPINTPYTKKKITICPINAAGEDKFAVIGNNALPLRYPKI